MNPRTLLAILLAAVLPACSRPPAAPVDVPVAATPAEPGPGAEAAAPATPAVPATMKDDHVVAAPRTFDNLTVFPITAKTQVDVGPISTLDDAIRSGRAEVREVGSEAAAAMNIEVRHRSGARVNTLVIENKGTIPVYVLAGTVVKGGNQDRQIGQDFIIDANQVADVDAFCVEHGRWTGQRDGQATGGKFSTASQLVTSSVRAAGQYQKNQGEVWAKVADVNAFNKKSAASGTLMATLDDSEIVKRREALARQVTAYLAGVQPNGDLVGIAYAVDGHVRGARWFVNHTVFDLYRATLVNTAAVDAITASAQRDPTKPAPKIPDLAPAAVTSFIAGIEAAKVAEARDTAAANTNEYKETTAAYGSKTMMKPKKAAGAPPTAAPPPAVMMSSDYLSK